MSSVASQSGDGNAPGILLEVMDPTTAAILERIRNFAIPSGAPQCKQIFLRQIGAMRLTPDRPWLPFTAEQTFSPVGLDFSWKAHSRILRLLPATIIDELKSHNGFVAVHVLGLFPIARFGGAAVSKGEVMRALAEMPWRPFGFIEQPNLIWEAAGEGHLRVTFDDGQINASVNFEIDIEGRVLGAGASDRPRVVGKSVVETPWSGTFDQHRFFGEVRIPTKAAVRWHLPEGQFDCWRGTATDFCLIQGSNS